MTTPAWRLQAQELDTIDNIDVEPSQTENTETFPPTSKEEAAASYGFLQPDDPHMLAGTEDEIISHEANEQAIELSGSSYQSHPPLPVFHDNQIETAGQFEVSQFTGDMTYHYALDLPAGRNGLTPDVALQYNSSYTDTNSAVGYGWELEIPKIERYSNTGIEDLYSHQFRSPFAGGQGKLVPTDIDANGYGSYDAKVNVTYARHDYLTDNTWKITTTDGMQYLFGQSADARLQNANGGKIHTWHLTEIIDLNGNQVIYDYTTNQGNPYLTTIRYGDLSAPYEVRFEPYYSGSIQTFDMLPQFDKGFAVIPHRDLLDQVTIFAPGTDDKLHYQLTYTNDGTFNLLTNIQKQGEDDAGLISDPPVTFDYDQYDGARSLPLTLPEYIDRKIFQWTTRIGVASHAVYGDYNHDGWIDVMMNYWDNYSNDPEPEDRHRVLYLNNKDGTWSRDDEALVDNWGNWRYPALFSYSNNGYYLKNLKLLDLNGDFAGNGFSTDVFEMKSDGGVNFSGDYALNFKDDRGSFINLNGDGLTDFITFKGTVHTHNQNRLGFNTGTGFIQPPPALELPTLTPDETAGYFHTGRNTPNAALQIIDINGDGLDDMMILDRTRDVSCVNNQNVSVNFDRRLLFLNQGHGKFADYSHVLDHDAFPNIAFRILGDQRTCLGNVEKEYDKQYYRFADVNRDGRPDLIDEHERCAFFNRGNALNGAECTALNLDGALGYDGTQFLDINNDTILDWTRTNYGYAQSDQDLLDQQILPPPTLSTVTTPLGATHDIEYTPGNAYEHSDGSLANPDLAIAKLTVSKITTDDGLGNVFDTDYHYAGGKTYRPQIPGGVNFQQFQGFSEVAVTYGDGSKTVTTFDQGDPAQNFAGKGDILGASTYEINGTPLQSIETTYLTEASGSGYHSVPAQTLTTQGDKSYATTFEYDQYGNVTSSTDHGEILRDGSAFTDVNAEDNIVETTTYHHNTGNHLVALPRQTERRDMQDSLLGKQIFFYDGATLISDLPVKGNLTKTRSYVDADTFVETSSTFNAFGQPTSFTDGNGNITSITYDTYNLYPATITNAKGHSTHYEHDYLVGDVERVTDPNSNQQTFTFDALGHLTEIQKTHPQTGTLFPSKTITYDLSASPSSIYTEDHLGHSNIAVSKRLYFDGLGRPIQVFVEAEDTDASSANFIVSSTLYDAKGRVRKATLPKFTIGNAFEAIDSNDIGNSTTYDALDRPLIVTTPVGSSSTTYNGWSQTVTDANGHQKTLTHDSRSNLIQVTENNTGQQHQTAYEYDLNGNLIKITDAEDNVKHLAYDLLGRNLSAELLHNPHASTIVRHTYSYDNNSNLIESADPNGNVVTTTYDALNRPLTATATHPDEVAITTMYSYDTSPNGIGQVSSIVSPDVTKAFEYNTLGNVAQETKTILNASYATAYQYDLQGNLQRMAYPGGSTIQYSYNTAGLPEGIFRCPNGTDACVPQSVVTNIDHNAAGLLQSMTYANGTRITKTYDRDQAFRLTSQQTETLDANTPQTLQQFAHTYDPVGNITDITHTQHDGTSEAWAYAYDDLDRLIAAMLDGETVRTFAYSPTGNILNKSDVGDYVYADTHPQAVTTVGANSAVPIALAYDPAGNLISHGDWSHRYDAKQRLVGSHNADQSISYIYDESRNRTFKTNEVTGSTTIYVGEHLDIIDGQEKQYIFLNNTRIATLDTALGQNCAVPANGDWIITQSCVITEDVLAPANTIVQAPAIMTVKDNASLYADLKTFNIQVKQGAGILIKQGSKIAQGSPETVMLSANEQSKAELQGKPEIESKPLPAAQVTPDISDGNIATFALPYGAPLPLSVSLYETDDAPTALSGDQTADDAEIFDWSVWSPTTTDNAETIAEFLDTFAANHPPLQGKVRNGLLGQLPVSELNSSSDHKQITVPTIAVEGFSDQETRQTLPAPIHLQSATNENNDPLLSGALPAGIVFHHANHLGSASLETDEVGNVLATATYYPFGSVKHEFKALPSYDNPYGYTDKERDDETSLHYYEARYYDTRIGRFTSVDPWFGDLKDPQSLNKYAYVRNNPLKYTDPTGETWQEAAESLYNTEALQKQLRNLPGDLVRGAHAAAQQAAAASAMVGKAAVKAADKVATNTLRGVAGTLGYMASPADGAMGKVASGIAAADGAEDAYNAVKSTTKGAYEYVTTGTMSSETKQDIAGNATDYFTPDFKTDKLSAVTNALMNVVSGEIAGQAAEILIPDDNTSDER